MRHAFSTTTPSAPPCHRANSSGHPSDLLVKVVRLEGELRVQSEFRNALHPDVDDLVDVLQHAFDQENFAIGDEVTIDFIQVRVDDRVADAGLIFEQEKDEAVRRAGTLEHLGHVKLSYPVLACQFQVSSRLRPTSRRITKALGHCTWDHSQFRAPCQESPRGPSPLK